MLARAEWSSVVGRAVDDRDFPRHGEFSEGITLRISGPARYALISKPTRPPAPLHAVVTRYGLFNADMARGIL